MKKKRILFAIHLSPPVHGSAVVGKQIHDSPSIHRDFDADYINLSTSRAIDEIGQAGIRKFFRIFSVYFSIFRHLATRKYDLCYLAPAVSRKGLIKDVPIAVLYQLFRRPILLHLHGKGVIKHRNSFFFQTLCRILFRCDCVALLSWRLYPDIQEYVDEKKVFICPNGIPEFPIPVGGRQKNTVPHLLFLSNLLPEKGILVMLDACRILKDRGCAFVCDVVGGTSAALTEEGFQNEVEKRKLSPEVHYHGKKFDTEKVSFFDQSDLFVFPTMNEAFGLVILEAMSRKLPVVATPEGSIPDIVIDGENGLLCEKNNPRLLADCIQRLLDDPELRRKMGEKGFERYQTLFTEKMFEQTFRSMLDHILSP